MAKLLENKFTIHRENDDILLMIKAPPEDFDKDTIEKFWDEVRKLGFKDAINSDVEKVFKEGERDKYLCIGKCDSTDGEESPTTQEDDSPPPEQPFEIEIQEDDLSATLSVKQDITSITEEQIRDYLKECGIEHGVIDENVEILVKEYPDVREINIAQGTPSTNGQDAKIEFAKPVKTDLTPETVDDGQADFKKLNLISPVSVGEVIQVRTPPEKGETGKDIFGKEIPGVDGEDKSLQKGDNTAVSEDGCSLTATEEGFIYIGVGDTVNIKAVYTVEEDVDYHTGIVEYKGDVVIKGDVRSGFDVHAGGDVHIRGSVEDATIEAGGDIQIDGGVCSSGEAVIKAGGDVRVNFIENASVETPGNVYINREAVSCDIRAGGNVEVQWNKGRIIGGRIVVGGWIAAPTLSSGMDNYAELVMQPKGWDEHCKKIEKLNERHAEIEGDENIDDEEKPAALEKLNGEKAGVVNSLKDLFAYSFVTAKSYIAPFTVQFGIFTQKIDTDLKSATFRFGDLEISHEECFIDEGQREKLRKERPENQDKYIPPAE